MEDNNDSTKLQSRLSKIDLTNMPNMPVDPYL
jgi:hypothetical protein